MADSKGQPIPEHASPRPRPVAVALWIIIATYALSGVTLVVSIVSGQWPAAATPQSTRWLAIVLVVVVYALLGGLIAALAYRRRWAWWVWLVFFVLGLPAMWSGLQRSLDQGALSGTRYALLTALDVAAVVLLLLRPSRQWYAAGRKRREPPPPIRSDEYDYPNWP